MRLLRIAQAKAPQDEELARGIATCHVDLADVDGAIFELQRFGSDESPEVALDLAVALESDEKQADALRVLQRCYAKNPRHESLRFKLARLAQELNLHVMAVDLLRDLSQELPDSIEYWGYLGNSCLALDLDDKAMQCYRRAQKLIKVDDSSQWINSNIGNLLDSCGLPSDAKERFEHALKFDPMSEYSHEKLALALKKIDAQQKLFDKKCTEGRKGLRVAITNLLVPVEPLSDKLLGLLGVSTA